MQIVVGDNKVDTLKLRGAAKHFNNNLHFDEFCVLVNLQRLAKAELPHREMTTTTLMTWLICYGARAQAVTEQFPSRDRRTQMSSSQNSETVLNYLFRNESKETEKKS